MSDLGIARFVDPSNSRTVGNYLTREWASPQQVKSRRFGRKADVFSLGLIRVAVFMKAEGIGSVLRVIRKDKGFGACPGLLSATTMRSLIIKTMIKLQRQAYVEFGTPFLNAMLEIEEQERASAAEVGTFLDQFITSIMPGKTQHCQNEAPDIDLPSDDERKVTDHSTGDEFWEEPSTEEQGEDMLVD